LFSALHESPSPGLQMLPGSRHEPPLSQRPNSDVGVAFEQWTGPSTGGGAPDHPQQSLSTRQTSPVGRHPDGGWQTLNPESAPKNPQEREQQVWSHGNAPVAPASPSVPVQTVPLGAQPLGTPPPLVGAPQTPVTLPGCFTQLAPQHSKLVEHTSPCCVQNETAPEQVPLLQRPEQHSVPVAHGFPAVRHVWPGLTLPHVPFVQMPLQQSPGWPHTPGVGLSGTHCLSAHAPFTHDPVQHSFGAAHWAAGSLHAVSGGAHVLDVASQLAVQQSLLFVQSWPTTLHTAASLIETSLGASLIPPSFGDELPSEPLPSCVLFPSPVPVSPASAPGAISAPSLPQPAKMPTGPSAATSRARAPAHERFLIRSSSSA
jgi:hypothetical protein